MLFEQFFRSFATFADRENFSQQHILRGSWRRFRGPRRDDRSNRYDDCCPCRCGGRCIPRRRLLRPQLAGTSANASPEAGSGVLATVERWSEVRVDRIDANTRLAHFGTSTRAAALATGLTGPPPSADWTVFSRPSNPHRVLRGQPIKPARAPREPTYRTVCVRLCDGACSDGFFRNHAKIFCARQCCLRQPMRCARSALHVLGKER